MTLTNNFNSLKEVINNTPDNQQAYSSVPERITADIRQSIEKKNREEKERKLNEIKTLSQSNSMSDLKRAISMLEEFKEESADAEALSKQCTSRLESIREEKYVQAVSLAEECTVDSIKSALLKMEAISRQGQRTDLTSGPVGQKSKPVNSRDELAKSADDSARQISRYIRLTQLIPELQDFVDNGKIKMRPAVELSYLDEEAQRDVVDLIDETEAFPSHDQAIRMRKAFDEGKLDYNAVDKIMKEEKPNQKPSYKLKYEDIKAYFKPGADFEVVLRDILKGLELLKKQRARENREAR